jgi:hypothetical protein
MDFDNRMNDHLSTRDRQDWEAAELDEDGKWAKYNEKD